MIIMPPQVYGVVCHPWSNDEFVTYGIKHLTFWRVVPVENPNDEVRGPLGTLGIDFSSNFEELSWRNRSWRSFLKRNRPWPH